MPVLRSGSVVSSEQRRVSANHLDAEAARWSADYTGPRGYLSRHSSPYTPKEDRG